MKPFPLRFFQSDSASNTRRLSWLWAVSAFFFLACALYLPPALSASTTYQDRELPIYCVDTDKPCVSLTFDGAWGNEDIHDILQTLEKQDVRATFFLSGDWIRSFPEDTERIAAAGHDIGNHGDTHLDLAGLSSGQIEEEIMGAHEALFALTGQSMDLFRPPYGSYDNAVIRQATSCGYFSIQWSVDSLDWKNYGREDIIDRVLNHKNLKNGAIILLHNGAKYTSSALDELICGLKDQGFSLLPVSELIYRENFHMAHDGTQISD